MPEAALHLPFAVDLRAAGAGIEGPTRWDPVAGELWWATVSPDGPATLRLRQSPSGIAATAWGEGAEWILRQAPKALGCDDRPDSFLPASGPVRDLARRYECRFGRTDRVFDALLPAILGQKVVVASARRSLNALTARYGEPAPAPGPLGRPLKMRPRAERIAELSSFQFHACGVERKRGDTIVRAAREAARLETAAGAGTPEAFERRMLGVGGIGPWTVALVRAGALGDADAVPIGDYHIPNHVCWGLAGEPRGTDARMLELLEPYRGHRGRVIALLRRGGIRAPRYGPRLARIDLDRMA